MRSSHETAIIKTLAYADVFDFPLTEGEVWERMIEVRSTKSEVQSALRRSKYTYSKSEYYVLKGREKIIDVRKKREEWSEEKIEITKRIINYLRFIPTVKLIGISGGLACMNADKDDDIDLFIIAASQTVWTTRFLTSCIVELMGIRRHPSEEKLNNKVCLNMFVDEDHLAIPENERDLYRAYEVALMKPIFERGGIYKRFLRQNDWVRKYLPNAYSHSVILAKLVLDSDRGAGIHSNNRTLDSRLRGNDKQSTGFHINLIEHVFRVLQLLYMQRRRTTEVVEEGRIRFHPHDARKWVLRRYKELLLRYQAAI